MRFESIELGGFTILASELAVTSEIAWVTYNLVFVGKSCLKIIALYFLFENFRKFYSLCILCV